MRRPFSLAVLLWFAPAVLAQGAPPVGFQCALGADAEAPSLLPAPGEPTPDVPRGLVPTRPLGRVVRALVVFVRFPDDDRDNAYTPCWRPTPDRTEPPPFAEWLFEPYTATPDPGRFDPESVTAYFHRQSAGAPGGPQLVFGDVWPRSSDGRPRVYVPRHPPGHYTAPGQGYWTLVHEILRHLETVPGLRLADYDRNGDGVFDQVVVLVRGDGRLSQHGASDLTAAAYVRGGRPVPRRYGGVGVDWDRSGQIHFVQDLCFAPTGQVDARGVVFAIAHEFGHDLFPEFEGHHLYPAFLNGVPTNEVFLPPREYRKSYDYNLMGGAPYPYATGARTMSVYERERLEWLTPVPLRRDWRGVEAGDLYTTGTAFSLAIGRVDGAPTRRLLLANRQRVGAFDRLSSVPFPGASEAVSDGLKTTGLAVELVQDLAPGEPLRVSFDVLPADGTLDASSFKSAYAGDLFGPDTAVQLTPWTRPNVNGCHDYTTSVPCNAPGFRPVFSALDALRYAGDADSTLVFDVYADWRTAPEITIREDSWMGRETAGPEGYTFTSPVRVTSGATLQVIGGSTIRFAGGLVVEPGATFVCEAPSVCVVGDGSLPPGVRSRLGAPYPNPAQGLAHVPFVLTTPADVSLVLHDALGRQLAALPAAPFGIGASTLDLDVTGLAAGVYVVRVRVVDGRGYEDRLTARLVVAR